MASESGPGAGARLVRQRRVRESPDEKRLDTDHPQKEDRDKE